MKNLTLREKIAELTKREEIQSFYDNVRTSLQNRAVTNGTIAVPTEIVDLVSELVTEQSVMLKHVRVLNLQGNANIILPGVIEDAVWVAYGGALQEKNVGLSKIELAAHKLGAFIVLPNDFEKDSAVNLGAYITNALSTSIAKAIDKAIVNGSGTNQPTGIITGTNSANKVTLAPAKQTVPELIKTAEKIDKKGDTASFKVFVKASTNYGKILPLTIGTNAEGRIVSFTDKFPATSWDIVECDAVPENTVIIGLASQYVVAQRETIVIDQSSDFKFTDDATVFRGLARYDGKLVNDKAFVVITLS